MRPERLLAACVASLAVAGGVGWVAVASSGPAGLVGASADLLPASGVGAHIWQSDVLDVEHVATGGVYFPDRHTVLVGALLTTTPHLLGGSVSVTFAVGGQTCSTTTVVGIATCEVSLPSGTPSPTSLTVTAQSSGNAVGVTQSGPVIVYTPPTKSHP